MSVFLQIDTAISANRVSQLHGIMLVHNAMMRLIARYMGIRSRKTDSMQS